MSGWKQILGIVMVGLLVLVAGCSSNSSSSKSTVPLSTKQIKTNIGSKLVTTRGRSAEKT